jgi:WD40 repeat protein
LATGKFREVASEEVPRARAPTFSPNGEQLAMLDDADGKVVVWDLAGERLHASLVPLDNHAVAIAYSHDGTRLLALGDAGTVQIWDLSSRELVSVYKYPIKSTGNAFVSPDGSRLLTLQNSEAKIWEAPIEFASRSLAETPTK